MSLFRYSYLFLLFVAMAGASQNAAVSGRVEMESGAANRLVVELAPVLRSQTPLKTMTAPDGSFDFRDVPVGEYQLRALNLYGELIVERFVTVTVGADTVILRVAAPQGSKPLTGTVSARALAAKLPKPARKLMQTASKRSAKGEHAEAARLLKDALAIAPDSAAVWCNLGVQQLHLGEVAEAEQSFAKSIALGGDQAMVRTNRAYALGRLGRVEEAADEARRAIRLDPSYLRGHYMLGVILMPDPRHADEAQRHLEAAEDEIPRAHVQLAELHARRGDHAGAARELREYLDTGSAEMRPQVEQWVSRLVAGK